MAGTSGPKAGNISGKRPRRNQRGEVREMVSGHRKPFGGKALDGLGVEARATREERTEKERNAAGTGRLAQWVQEITSPAKAGP